jgi:hypothetical protein
MTTSVSSPSALVSCRLASSRTQTSSVFGGSCLRSSRKTTYKTNSSWFSTFFQSDFSRNGVLISSSLLNIWLGSCLTRLAIGPTEVDARDSSKFWVCRHQKYLMTNADSILSEFLINSALTRLSGDYCYFIRLN